MALSKQRTARLAVAVLGMLMLLAQLAPAGAGAGTDGALARSSADGGAQVAAAAQVRPCINDDPKSAGHHDEKSTAQQAEDWERGARKHAHKGDHERAAAAYKIAACLWDTISEHDKAEAAYEKAAEQYDKAAEVYEKAGEADKAAEMKKKAQEIRDMLP